MKKSILSLLSAVAIFATFSCSGPKKITVEEATGRKEVITPFSEPKYRTDKDTYRASQVYKHPNENTVRSYSAVAARAELLAQVKADVSSFIKNYEATYAKGNDQDVSGVLNVRIGQLAEDLVSDAIIVDSKLYLEPDGRYTCYTLVEKSRKATAAAVYEKTISEDDKLKILFDKKKFEEEYDKWKESRKQ
jgi:hypothetical protein